MSSIFLSICVHVIALILSRSDHPVMRCTLEYEKGVKKTGFFLLLEIVRKHAVNGTEMFSDNKPNSLFIHVTETNYAPPPILTNNPLVNQTINRLPVKNVWACLFSHNMFYFLHPPAPK